MRVFYEDWQMECCGLPFAVGDEVAWPLVAVTAEERRERCYGAEAWVENHGDRTRPAAGRVRAVELVRQEYLVHTDRRARERVDRALDPDAGSEGLVVLPSPYRWEAVPGAYTLQSADGCPKWFEPDEPGPDPGPQRLHRTVGALVTLEPTGDRP
ncbi:hypothetical protein QWJ26_29460 [Streptomyces sp. CSDS2]|uniref:DUF6578 domain-containing protein n=1 Tax=Streptomyces sp. CSDS2 TaxID=3055051 RepID=UPI0025B167C9|nr:DUF6578 domain-containing protein [Streptomyces sp. CSDS2]MDN3263864.1 hypothetical protein [Streptomyces sp. CSDS2]